MGLFDVPPRPLSDYAQLSTLKFNSLRAWRAALGARAYAPADIVAIGDSVTEGQGATVATRRWLDQMLTQLRAQYPSGVTGGSGYIPASNVETSYTSRWTLAGGAAANLFGLAMRGAQLSGAGQTLTISQTCTSFKIYYLQGQSNTGPFTVQVDGGSTTTVTPTTSGGFSVAVYTSGALAAASHTIVIGYSSTQTAFILGGFFFNGDESAGIRLIDSGHYGYTTSSFSAAITTAGNIPGNNFFNGGYAALPNAPALVIICLGLNDYSGNVAPATAQTNLQTIITGIKAIHTTKSWSNPSFLLVYPYRRMDVTSPTYAWATYLPYYQQIASQDTSNVGLIALTDRIDTNSNKYGLLTGDNTHPNDSGHGWFGDIVAANLRPS